jgi:Tol biopolymer transport system component
VRENPEDKNADTSSEALISNIYIMEVESEAATQVTKLMDGYAETPFWSPDGNTLAFNVVINGRMQMHIVDIDSKGVGSSNPLSPELENLGIESICCPAWMRK